MPRTRLISWLTTIAYVAGFVVLPVFGAPQSVLAACDDSQLKKDGQAAEQSINTLQTQLQPIANLSSGRDDSLVKTQSQITQQSVAINGQLDTLKDDVIAAAQANCETEFNTYNTNLSTYVQQYNREVSTYNGWLGDAKKNGLKNPPPDLPPHGNPGLTYDAYAGNKPNATNNAKCQDLITKINAQNAIAQQAIDDVTTLIAGKSSLNNSEQTQFNNDSTKYADAFRQAGDLISHQAAAIPGCNTNGAFTVADKSFHDLATQSIAVGDAASAIDQSWGSVAKQTFDSVASCGCGKITSSGVLQGIFNQSICVTICTVSDALGVIACYIIQFLIDPVFGSGTGNTCTTQTATPSSSSSPSAGPTVNPSGGGLDLTPLRSPTATPLGTSQAPDTQTQAAPADTQAA